MAKPNSEQLGTNPVGKLLLQQSVPAAIGFLVLSLNVIVDTIFVGNWIGSVAIAAINVVLPVSFFMSALGMAIGIGGASIISRALGSGDKPKALNTFGNQILLTLVLTLPAVAIGLAFVDTIIPAFGGKGAIFEPAKIYYTIVLYGVPVIALCMMANNVIRAEGNPIFSMIAYLIISIGNLLLDYIFIYILDWGMHGAAWATTISHAACGIFMLYYFFSKNSEIKINWSHFKFNLPILKEIGSLGIVSLLRQAVTSIIYLLLNNILFGLGGEALIAVYAIIGRMLFFIFFPVIGITQGFLPIAGYNYGARQYKRVKESIITAIKYASIASIFMFLLVFLFPTAWADLFLSNKPDLPLKDQEINAYVLNHAPKAIRLVFLATPILAIQLIGSAYFQAIGKAVPALLLTLTRQGFFFIPLILILPNYFEEFGVWISFPIADLLSTIVTGVYLWKEVQQKLMPAN